MYNLIRKHSFLCVVIFLFIPAHFFSQVTFSPKNISGLRLWLNADSVNYSTTPNIDKCYDLSDFHNHAIQNNSAKQPITVASTLNGHKVMRFDGVDDFMAFTPIDSIRSLFMVFKHSTGTATDYPPILGHRSTFDFIGSPGTPLSNNTFIASGITNGLMKMNSIVVNPLTTMKPVNYTILDIIASVNLQAEYITNDRNTFGCWNGDYAEIIIYNTALNSAEISAIENYLVNKYAPTLELGSDIAIPPLNGCTPSYSISITANPDFQNYIWSNGNTTNQINVTQYGEYSVICEDIFGIKHYDTVNVVPTPKNFNYPSTVLCGSNTIIWNTQLDKTAHIFNWQDGSLDSLFVINSPGQYHVTITDTFGCAYISNTLTVTQDNFPTTASLGPDITMCSGNFITLTQGMSPSLTYTWSTSSNNDSLLITTTGLYSVIVTNTNNCVAKDTISVTVQGFAPTANFSLNIGCVNQIVSFTDLSIPPSGNTISNYEWDFGDTASPTNTSTVSNPSHTYTNTGTYTVNLTVTTNTGCAQSIVKLVNVYPVPTSTFSFGTSCQNDSTSFLNQSTGITGYSITSSYWNFGDFPSPTYTSNISSPKHVFANVINYSITLVVTNSAGCASSVTKTLTPYYEVKANFTNGPACLNSPTNFQSTSIIPPTGTPTYAWNFGNSTATSPNPIKTFASSGVYFVTLAVDGTNGCTSTITKLVNVYLPPITSFSIPSFCSKDTANIINLSNPQSGIMASYNWKLNNTTFSTIQSPTLSLTSAGNYSVRLTNVNSFGCKDSTTHSLTIFPLPVVDFSTTPVAFYYENEPVNFIPSVANANSYLWNINGASTYTIQSPTETFNTENSYNISLNLKDQNGCKGSKTKNITVSKRHLDLAVLNVSTTKDNDGFMTVVADIANYGSVPINSFKMGYQISDGGNIKETWNGTLNPNSFYTFTFNATSASLQNSSNNITCVEIEKVNTIIDDNTTNNSFCSSLNIDGIYVGNPLPNPTNGDIVLPITLNRGFDYTIAIYNSVGQIHYEETTKKGIEGLNFVTLNTSSYARGAYIIKVMIDEKIFIKKFIKVSYE